MKKLLSFSLVVGLLTAVVTFGAGSRANTQSAGLVSSILTRMERNKRSLRTLHANISMQKYNAQLRDSDNYQGVVFYIPGVGASGSFVRLEWTQPQHEILAVAKGNYI